MSSQRLPPQDKAAEEAVLSAMFYEPPCIDRVLAFIGPQDFYRVSHQIIFEVMADLHTHGVDLTLITVKDELAKRKKLEQVGGFLTLLELADAGFTTVGLKEHCRILREKALHRRLIDMAVRKVKEAYDPAEDVEMLLNEIRVEAEKLSMAALDNIPFPLSLVNFQDQVRRFGQRRPVRLGELDAYVGLYPSELTLIAARPGEGKTTCLLNLLLNLADSGQCGPLVYFDFETGEVQTKARMLSLLSVHSSRSILDMHRPEKLTLPQDVIDAHGELARLSQNIYLVADPDYSVRDISASCAWVKKQVGEIGAVFVDYLGLVKPEGRAESEELRLAGVVRGLRKLAQTLETPVVVATQASRKTVKGAFPGLDELRYSGSQEQEASVVLGLRLDKEKQTLEAKILKNRYGEVPYGHFQFGWNCSTGRISGGSRISSSAVLD